MMQKLKQLLNNYYYFLILLSLSAFYNALYYQPFGIRSNYFVWIAFIWSIYFMYHNIKDSRISKKNKVVGIVFIVVCIVSTVLNYSISSLESFINIFVMLIMIFAVFFHNNKDEKILKTIIILTFIFDILSLLTYLFGIYITAEFTVIGYYNRLWGIYNNPNTLGAVSALSILLSIDSITKKKSKVFNGINIILQSYVLFLSKSRTCILGLGLTVLIYVFFKYICNKGKINKKTLLIIFMVMIQVVLFIVMINDTTYSLLNKPLSNRLRIWLDIIDQFSNRFFFGYGVSNMYTQFCEVSLLSEHIICLDYVNNAHNWLYDVLFSCGFTGISSFCCMMFRYFWEIKNTISCERFSILLFIILLSTIDYGFLFSNSIIAIIFWYVLSMEVN